MEAIFFIGLQASGKSSFYKEHFFNSHLRISNDLLKTKNRQARLLEFCFETSMPFVIDNTNPTREIRASYLEQIKVRQWPVHDRRRKIGFNPKENRAVISTRKVLETDYELPQGDAYSEFLWQLLKDNVD
ncbi:hypothetical protein ACO0LC_24150 [Undibacterium sp. JH2W]|uniref:hypothetical protein n=1 Tax=Undibacterium sp. JH2W TaxID=3413037 RepID=UPI003BF38281